VQSPGTFAIIFTVKPKGTNNLSLCLYLHLCIGDDKENSCLSLFLFSGYPNNLKEEIIQNKGTLYDPEAVDACLKLFKEKGFKFK